MKKILSTAIILLIVLSTFSIFSPNAAAYTNPITREFFVDAPHRVEPGKDIPILALIKDADEFLQDITLKRIDIRSLDGSIDESHFYDNEYIAVDLWYDVFYVAPLGLYLDGWLAEIIVTFHGDSRFQENFEVDRQVDVWVSVYDLPKFSGWYAGDAHIHSSMTQNILEFGPPVDAIASAARAVGLDWVIITDHGHDIDPFPDEWYEYNETCANELNTIPGEFICMLGEEITVKLGKEEDLWNWGSHYLAYNISSPIYAPDYGNDVRDNPTAQDAINDVANQDGIGFIAHPIDHVRPWRDWTVDNYTGIEIWNGGIDDSDQPWRNEEAMAKWYEMLTQGEQVFGIGNSDAHNIYDIAKNVRTYVYLGTNELTENNIIDALRNGRSIVTDGPLLTFTVDGHIIGETFSSSGNTVDLYISWKSTAEYGKVKKIDITVGRLFISIPVDSYEGTISMPAPLPSTGVSYALVSCETETGRRAFTNPIWVCAPLNILTPTSSEPAIAGDPNDPIPILVSVEWIPSHLLDPLMIRMPTFSVNIGGKAATYELTDKMMTIFGIYTVKVYPPTQPSEGLYDLDVTATFDETTDSDTEPESVKYTLAPSIEPIEKGLAWLRTRQYADGSWRSNVGVTSLAVLAFLNVGYDETDTTVSKAINYILSNVKPDGSIYYSYPTYETSLAILPLVATRNDAYKTTIENAKNWLVNSQWDESCLWGSVNKDSWYYGGFGYGWGYRPDLSNSQFALLALDAAGLPKDHPLWTKAQVFLHRCQNIEFPITLNIEGSEYTVQPYNLYGGYDGGFIYYPGASLAGGQKSYGSMTGAGIWGLLLSGVPKTDPRTVAAINWVKNHYTWDTNPGLGWTWPYYYYLSMSKALTMYGESIIDGHDWYSELYDKIVGMQIDAGSDRGYWSTTAENYDPDLTTAYAILSLQTRAIAPPVHRLSYLTFILRSNCLLRIIDSEGNLVGYNYMTGLGENNVPRAVYSGPFFEPQYIIIVNPQAGTYRLELIGVSEGPYELTIQGNYGEAVTDIFEYAGEIKPAELHGSDVTVTAIVGPIDIYANPPEFEEIIDNIPPTTTLEIGEPKYVDPMDNVYVSSATPFTLTAEDNPGGTGVALTAYRIHNATYDSDWLTYTEPFYLIGLSNGAYQIDYNSTDNAGNVEETNIVAVILRNPLVDTWMTDSNFNKIESFRVIFTPYRNTGLYKLTSTNPGQFYFNILVNNTWPEPLNITIAYSIDANFTFKGARPIHVYADLLRTIDITANCAFLDNTITVYNVPSKGIAYVTIHLDYVLKGTKWTKSQVDAWYSEHTFIATADSITSSVTITDPIIMMLPVPAYLILLMVILPSTIMGAGLLTLLKYGPLTKKRRKED